MLQSQNRTTLLDYFCIAFCPAILYGLQVSLALKIPQLEGDLTFSLIAPFLLQLQETQDHFKDCPPLVALKCFEEY